MSLKVLSIYDRISCGYLALQRLCIPVDKYVAYEADYDSVEVSKANFPQIEHRGDVLKETDFKQFSGFDLLLAGSNVSKVSIANVLRNNNDVVAIYKDPVFKKFIEALVYAKPKYFVYDNVAFMNQSNIDAIFSMLGVKPVLIDSINFSAQKRKRLIWTNLPLVPPEKRRVSIELKDILEANVSNKYHLTQKGFDYVTKERTGEWKNSKEDLNPRFARAVTSTCSKHHRASVDTYITTSHTPANKTNTRMLTPTECERAQTFPDGYTSILKSDSRKYSVIGRSQTVESFVYVLSFMP